MPAPLVHLPDEIVLELDDVPGRGDPALAVRGGVLQRDGDGMVGGGGVDAQVDHLQAVVGFQPGGRVAHDVEKHVVHPRLVDQHMGHLGDAVGHVLHTGDASQRAPRRRHMPAAAPRGGRVILGPALR